MRALLLLGASTIAAVTASNASADVAAAAELFQEGRDALARGDLELACAKFGKSAELEARVGTLLNLAQCEESRGHLSLARRHWLAAADLAHATADSRETVARDRLGTIDKRIPTLSIQLDGAVTGATVTCDGVPVPSTSLGVPLSLDPGSHTVIVSVSGRPPTVTAVALHEAEQRKLTVHVAVAERAPVEERETSNATRSALTWTFGGVSLAAIGVGSWFGAQAIRLKNDAAPFCPESNACHPEGLELREDAERAARISTISFAIGGVALASSIVLWATTPRRASSPAVAVTLSPAAVSFGGRF